MFLNYTRGTWPKDTFCSYCGAKYSIGVYPKTCATCKTMIWDNPLPVAVLLIEYNDGIYLVRRGIEPGRGLLALPGGYIVVGETWQEAAAREAMEEIQVKIDPKMIGLVSVCSSTNFKNILAFGYVKVTDNAVLPFVKNEETEERILVHEYVDLVFPTHAEILEDFFMSRRYKRRP